MNYYERYVGDFQRDTGHLSCAEIGVYDRLLDHYYGTEEPLPSNHADLCRIARAMDKIEQKAVKRVADEFFHIGDDGLLHKGRQFPAMGGHYQGFPVHSSDIPDTNCKLSPAPIRVATSPDTQLSRASVSGVTLFCRSHCFVV